MLIDRSPALANASISARVSGHGGPSSGASPACVAMLRPVDEQRVRRAAVPRRLRAPLAHRLVERLEPARRIVAQMRAPSGATRTTSQASPSFSKVRMTMLERSTCHHFSPCTEEVGNA